MKKKNVKSEEKKKQVKKENNEIEVEVVKEDKTEEEKLNNEVEKEKTAAEDTTDRKSELEREVQELKDTLLRKVAEFENYKRRKESEQELFAKYAAENFIVSILPVYDDLERSVKHLNESDDLDSLKKGIQMVFEKFKKILEDHGVKKIEAKGQPFDFNLHEALMQQPAEGVEPHTVLDEIESGYMYKDKVIKHAKVIVSQEVAGSNEANENNGEKE